MLIQYFIASLFWINVSLFVFNMLPIYPLDGFRLLESLTGGRGKFFNFVRRYGFYILLGIFVLGYIADWANIPYLDVIGYLSQKLGNGIILLWQSILKI
ncbi:MAG: site-2 protease family protein [Eubacteriales bacterium]|nr:site-2 protease family protein [Eubacteriales bacterium]